MTTENDAFQGSTAEKYELRLQAFKLAVQVKPTATYNPMGAQNQVSYSVKQLIDDADQIFRAIIK